MTSPQYGYSEDRSDDGVPPERARGWRPPGQWLELLTNGWQLDELAAEVGREAQTRIVIAGLPGAGKRTLYNRLRGWGLAFEPPPADWPQIWLEHVGLFVLADLPAGAGAADGAGPAFSGDEVSAALGTPDVVLYLLDARRGITPADYRWIAALRAQSRPLVLALNKCEAPAACQIDAARAQALLGMPVLAISAASGLNVEPALLHALLDAAPRVAIPLGREVASLRREAAWRISRQTALLSAMLGVQPVPGLEIPFLALLHVGMVLRLGAVYGHQPGSGLTPAAIATVGLVMALHYVIQVAVKAVPLVGSVVGVVLNGLATLLIGEIARRYYAAGRTLRVRPAVERLGQQARAAGDRLRRRLAWRRAATVGDTRPPLEAIDAVDARSNGHVAGRGGDE